MMHTALLTLDADCAAAAASAAAARSVSSLRFRACFSLYCLAFLFCLAFFRLWITDAGVTNFFLGSLMHVRGSAVTG